MLNIIILKIQTYDNAALNSEAELLNQKPSLPQAALPRHAALAPRLMLLLEMEYGAECEIILEVANFS